MMDEIMDFVFDYTLKPLLIFITVLMVAGCVIGIPYGLYSWATYKPPETFELRRDSWKCSQSHLQEYEVCAKGCSWHTKTVCDQYERI